MKLNYFNSVPALVALAGWIFLFSTSGAKTMLYAAGVVALGIVCFLIRARLANRSPLATASRPPD